MNDQLHDLVGAYAVNALSDDERAAFEAHLAACPACRSELAEHREVLGALADAHPVIPPVGLEAVVLASPSAAALTPHGAAPEGTEATSDAPGPVPVGVQGVGTGPGASGSTVAGEPATAAAVVARRREPRAATWLGAAAAAAAIFAGGVLVGRQVSTEPVAAGAAAVVAVASAGDAHFLPIDIMGTETRVVMSDEMGKAAFLASDLPTPAKGMAYQVWLVTEDGRMVSAGAFTPDEQGRVAVVLEGGTGDVAKLMVTMEPPGGSEHPTGEMLAEVTT